MLSSLANVFASDGSFFYRPFAQQIRPKSTGLDAPEILIQAIHFCFAEMPLISGGLLRRQ